MTIRANREPDLTPILKGFPYQAEALAATKDLTYAAIFHEQGLGKTKIGVDLALAWLSSNELDSVIIVTKNNLVPNWIDELRMHTCVVPRLLTQNRKNNFLAFNSPARIYLTHYEVIKSEQARLALFLKTRHVGVILDEAHKIKNPQSEVTSSLHKLATGFKRRIIMTGTPVANRPYDLWSQIYFLDQGASLGIEFSKFKHNLDLTNDMSINENKRASFEDDLSSVFAKIRSFSIRETKKGATISLPKKNIAYLTVDMEPRQAEIYNQYRRECESILLKSGKPLLDEAQETVKLLLRLVQIASNPRIIDESYHAQPGKLLPLTDLVSEIMSRGEKVIIWSNFTKNVDWLYREFRQYNAVRVHGKLAFEQRKASIKAFKTDHDCRILVATPASAKEGLTLTGANNAIFYDRSFSLDDYLQAQDRIHRISQERECTITNLIAIDSIDQWVDALLNAKHLAAQLIQGDISQSEYHVKADYSFGDMIKDVLGKKEDGL